MNPHIVFEMADAWDVMGAHSGPSVRRETLRECADMLRTAVTLKIKDLAFFDLNRMDIYVHTKRGTHYRYYGAFRFIQTGDQTVHEADTLDVLWTADGSGAVGMVNPDRNEYPVTFIARANLQDASGIGLSHGDLVVLYGEPDKKTYWARKFTEFHDGRFTRIEGKDDDQGR